MTESAYRKRFNGFPKRLPCLVCGRMRRASGPGHRIHAACQSQASDLEMRSEMIVAIPESARVNFWDVVHPH